MKICEIDGCEEPVRARGMCNVHYRRLLRTGDPNTVKIIHGDTVARFLSKVDKNGPFDCWIWTGHTNDWGYGVLGVGGNQNQLAHRWSYEHHIAPIPDGLVIDHLCRVRNCVNPAHLEPVTPAQNTGRGGHGLKTHCVNGHEYNEANTQWVTARVCKACRDDQKGAYYATHRKNLKVQRIPKRKSKSDPKEGNT